MPDILSQICAAKLKHIEAQKTKKSSAGLYKQIKDHSYKSNFQLNIEKNLQNKTISIIAEIKKASPSKGIIRQNFDPAIAKTYESAGATCISVLTDAPYFQASDEHLKIVKATSSLPILRKDFILDEYQIIESRILGADCILLIMAILSLEDAKKLEQAAINLGMDVLVEVHNEEELAKALQLKTRLIGINNRNLKDFSVDLNTSINLSKKSPGTK